MTGPIAARLRPQKLEEFFGQKHLLAKGKPLYLCLTQGHLHSMILWGPPGTGKTTLAKLIAKNANARFCALSAVMAGVKDIREAMQVAEKQLRQFNEKTILFIDEIHRFNKSQQDALLPYVEDGIVYLIGATTENPSFEVNHALLSRSRCYVLKRLEEADLKEIVQRAILLLTKDGEQVDIKPDALEAMVRFAKGDARRLLNLFEVTLSFIQASDERDIITLEALNKVFDESMIAFDKLGEHFYDHISALHKSVRGSSPDGALYWLARMLKGGCDPLYIARRVVRMASEDIGNADPRALTLALNAWDVVERLGTPEGELALAQAVTYLASTSKSNAAYVAFNQAMKEIEQTQDYEVPLHIRNAPTKLMKNLNYGKNYRYDPNEPDGIAYGQTYFPEKMGEQVYYQPKDIGIEKFFKEKLSFIRNKNEIEEVLHDD